MLDTTNQNDYDQQIDDTIAFLKTLDSKKIPPMTHIIDGLTPKHPSNYKLREFVVKTLGLSGKTFDMALNTQAAIEAGYKKDTPAGFVQEVAHNLGITAQYNGILRKNQRPYLLDDDGTRRPINENNWNDPLFRLIVNEFRRTMGFDEFLLVCYTDAVEYRRPFKSEHIKHAAELWYRKACRDRLHEVEQDIAYTDIVDRRKKGQDALTKLVAKHFDTSETSVAYGVSLFNKFIWQVKRKILSLDVFDHLMLVLLGGQRCGKSTLIRLMLGPIAELSANSDFSQITDNRNIQLWNNFAIFMDEMGHATRSDMAVVKNVITADTLSRRPMGLNTTIQVRQQATLIGTANANSLADLINDPTGIRRFASLTMIPSDSFDAINEIDWLAVWQSVDPHAPDPTINHRESLALHQEAARVPTPIEDWLADLEMVTGATRSGPDLYLDFREFEITKYPASRGTSMCAFCRNLKGMIQAKEVTKLAIEPTRGRGIRYIWLG